MFVVYAIRNLKTGRIYIGQTKNFEDRLRDHNAGHVQSTKKDKPWELYALQNMENRKEAMNVEWKLKKSKGARLRWLERHRIREEAVAQKENTKS